MWGIYVSGRKHGKGGVECDKSGVGEGRGVDVLYP